MVKLLTSLSTQKISHNISCLKTREEKHEEVD